jgi:hypothetical protein
VYATLLCIAVPPAFVVIAALTSHDARM